MGVEIERKFLVATDGWRDLVTSIETLQQGYLTSGTDVTVRVRIIDGARAQLTIKGGGATLSRSEFEYDLPVADARHLLRLCSGVLIEKRRHILSLAGGAWVVDVFGGEHEGLVLAEVELADAGTEITPPSWLGAEVTGDPAYYNSSLANIPAGGDI